MRGALVLRDGLRPPQDERGLLVARQAEQWIDVPFVWQGRIRGGCDCKGLAAGIAAELSYPEAASLEALCGDYGYKVPTVRLRAGLSAVFDRVAIGDRLAGDVLLCVVGGKPQHLAICAPLPGRAERVIEALELASKVRPFRRGAGVIDSVWRWKSFETPPVAVPQDERAVS